VKKINQLLLNALLLFCSVMILNQAFGQQPSLIDAKTALGINYQQPFSPPAQGATRNGCEYLVDDGTHENSIGLTMGGDLFWLNYFTTTASCEVIHTISIAWGLMSNGGLCTILLYDDPNDDGNPIDAVLLYQTTTTVANADLDIFTDVNITPTLVSGGFCVAAIIWNHPAGEFPASIDWSSPSQLSSWIAYSNSPPFDIYNLGNPNHIRGLIDDFGFGGNWLLRAEGQPAAVVPISEWALYIGILLMLTFIVIRFRKMI